MLKVFTGGATLSQDLEGDTKIMFQSQWIWNPPRFWASSVGFTEGQCHSHFYSLWQTLNLRSGWLYHRICPVSCCHHQHYFLLSQSRLLPHPKPVPVVAAVLKLRAAGYFWLWCHHPMLGQGSWEVLTRNITPRNREMQSLGWQVTSLHGVPFPTI